MSTLAFILAVVLNGLVIGALARLALPGPDPMGIPQTIGLGIAGSLAGGLIAYYVFDESAAAGFLFAVAVTVGLVYLVRQRRDGDATAPGGGRGPRV